MSHLTVEQRSSIIALRESGVSISGIAKRYGISRKTVYRWTERYHTEGNVDRHPKTGRRRTTTASQDAEMLAAVVSEHAVDRRKLSLKYNVSMTTIRRRLRLEKKKRRKTEMDIKDKCNNNQCLKPMKAEDISAEYGTEVLSEHEPFVVKEENNIIAGDTDTEDHEGLFKVEVKWETQDCQQDVCRLCLSQGRFESMDRELSCGERSGSYSNILETALGLTLVRVCDGSHICGDCANKLLEILAFRRQIIESERVFLARNTTKMVADDTANVEDAKELRKAKEVETDENSEKVEAHDVKSAVNVENELEDDWSSDDDAPLNMIPPAKRKTMNTTPALRIPLVANMHPLDAPMIRMYHCGICTQKFKTSTMKFNHIETVHGPRCSICRRRFVNMKEHLESHEASVLKCDICNKAFYKISHIEHHKRTVHNVHKTAPCPQCDYVGIDYSCLKKHMICHSADKKYECKQCNKKFARKTGLTNHELLHTGEKPYVCELCGGAFTQCTSLRYHKQKYHLKKR